MNDLNTYIGPLLRHVPFKDEMLIPTE